MRATIVEVLEEYDGPTSALERMTIAITDRAATLGGTVLGIEFVQEVIASKTAGGNPSSPKPTGHRAGGEDAKINLLRPGHRAKHERHRKPAASGAFYRPDGRAAEPTPVV